MLYRGTDYWAVIPAGSDGNVLTYDATQGVPKWLGAGGGFGNPWWLSTPPANTFSLLSPDPSNLTLADNPEVGLTVNGGPTASGIRVRTALLDLPDKNAPFTITMRSDKLVPEISFSGCGLVLRDSISGRVSVLTMRWNSQVGVLNFSNLSTYSSTTNQVALTTECKWFQIEHTGSQYIFRISPDGKIWHAMATVASTSFLTNKADQYGIAIDYDRATGFPNYMSVGHLSIT